MMLLVCGCANMLDDVVRNHEIERLVSKRKRGPLHTLELETFSDLALVGDIYRVAALRAVTQF